jgi:hypothetical protein
MRAQRKEQQLTVEALSPPEAEYHPRTPLGKRLWDLRQQILIAEDVELLDWSGVERELAERRGESRG